MIRAHRKEHPWDVSNASDQQWRPNYFRFQLVESYKFGLAQDWDLTGLLQFQLLKGVSSGERKLGDPSAIVFNQWLFLDRFPAWTVNLSNQAYTYQYMQVLYTHNTECIGVNNNLPLSLATSNSYCTAYTYFLIAETDWENLNLASSKSLSSLDTTQTKANS